MRTEPSPPGESARAAWSALAVVFVGAIGCAAPAPPASTTPTTSERIAARDTAPSSATGSTSSPTRAAAPSAPPVEDTVSNDGLSENRPQRIRVVLAPDQPPCELEIDAGLVDDTDVDFAVGGVVRLATIEGGACAAGVLYDLEAERARAPEAELDALMGGRLRKPGVDAGEGWEGDDTCRLEDLDFDGWADLCLVEIFGSYNYSQRCWRFDPSTRTFRREPDLEPLTFATIDRANRRIESAHRVTGPIYAWQRHVWEQGTLVLDADEMTYVGETPKGKPLTPPATEWVRRRERKRGKLVVVRDGPVAPKPE